MKKIIVGLCLLLLIGCLAHQYAPSFIDYEVKFGTLLPLETESGYDRETLITDNNIIETFDVTGDQASYYFINSLVNEKVTANLPHQTHYYFVPEKAKEEQFFNLDFQKPIAFEDKEVYYYEGNDSIVEFEEVKHIYISNNFNAMSSNEEGIVTLESREEGPFYLISDSPLNFIKDNAYEMSEVMLSTLYLKDYQDYLTEFSVKDPINDDSLVLDLLYTIASRNNGGKTNGFVEGMYDPLRVLISQLFNERLVINYQFKDVSEPIEIKKPIDLNYNFGDYDWYGLSVLNNDKAESFKIKVENLNYKIEKSTESVISNEWTNVGEISEFNILFKR